MVVYGHQPDSRVLYAQYKEFMVINLIVIVEFYIPNIRRYKEFRPWHTLACDVFLRPAKTFPGAKLSFGAFRAVRTGGDLFLRGKGS